MVDIDDPFRATSGSDATVIRPRPGGGRGRVPPTGIWPGASDAPPFGTDEPPAAILRSWSGTGLTPLVEAAAPLLLLAAQLRGAIAAPDLAGLRRQALDQIRRFEEQARAAGMATETVLTARYALCASLDEAVLSTPWGAQGGWAQQTLLVSLHREAWGGEKFFEMLDRIVADPDRYLDLIEVQYLCLAFGFTGRYHVLEQGPARLLEIQQRLYQILRDRRGVPPADLSLQWQGVEDRRNPLVRYVPWWTVGAAALAIVVVTFTVAYASLARASAPINEVLTRAMLAPVGPLEPGAAIGVAAAPTLRELLADDLRRDALSVEEDGARTTITLKAPDLFASASADVNPAYSETLRRVAGALREVPGQVQVIGHTDSLPLRSLTFRNNYELSRARAGAVVEIMQPAIDHPARLEPTGVGELQPRYEPASNPANRRVEIVHLAVP